MGKIATPIASDFASQTQIAALFMILMHRTVELRIANRVFRIAAHHESLVLKSLVIPALDRAISTILGQKALQSVAGVAECCEELQKLMRLYDYIGLWRRPETAIF